MNELKRKILQSDFYRQVYENKNTRSVELSVASLERGMQEAAAIFQCPIYELTYKILEEGSKGFFNIGAKPFLIRFTHITYDKSNIGMGQGLDYGSSNTNEYTQEKILFNKDTDIVVRVKRDGVFLKVTPPVANGKRIESMTALEDRLIDAGIKEYDSHLAKKMLHEQTGKYAKIGEWDPARSVNNAKISYSISDDKMRAYVTVTKPHKGGREMDLQDVKEIMENCGVTFGFQEENVIKCLEEGTFNVPILAAEGRAPVNGQNAKIEYLVNVNKKVIPKYIGEDQSIDYKDLSIVENVQQGQRLAKKVAATDGEIGRTVLGVKIETKSGKDIDIKEVLGDNVEMADDEYIVASINGQVVLKGKSLNVEPIFEVSGDVGPETGNINFIGSVVVKGSVSDNYSIKAEGNIDVHGTVGKCDLEAKGDIMVKLGIQGNENSYVKAGGDVIAKFIQFSNVQAGNNVVVTEAILNSNIDSDNRIILIGKRASASGGRLRALREVNGKVLGSQAGSKTLIETGISPAKRRAIDDLDKEKEELDLSIEETERNIKSLEQAAKLKKLDDEKKEQLQSYREQLDQASSRREEVVLEREALVQEMEIEKVESTVSAGKEMLPGVQLTIGSAEFTIRQSYKAITFFEEGGMIQTEKYRGEPKNDKKEDGDEE